MNELMQPIHPAYAALLSGKRPEPCEPFVEVSSKALARLLDVVEFGDQLERVEKDNLLASMKELLAQEQPELWVIHSVGPGELHPMISKEAADSQAAELAEMFKEHVGKLGLRFDVIRSPFTPLEHFEILAEELTDHRDNLLGHCNALEKKLAERPALKAEVVMPNRLDDKYKEYFEDVEGDSFNYALYLRDVEAAIEAAGMKAAQAAPAVAMPPEISRDLLGKIVDEVFDGAIEDASVIEDVYRVIVREQQAAPAVVNQQVTTAAVAPDALEQARRHLSNAIEDAEDGKTAAALPALREAAHFLAQAAASTVKDSLSVAASDVLAERQRQITAEGYDSGHDDMATRGQLAIAAGCYAMWSGHPALMGRFSWKAFFPWDWKYWKPSTPRRNLIRAGALILAEIERLDRAEQAKQQEQQEQQA